MKPLTNIDINECIKKYKINNFRGVFARNELPSKPWKKECGVLNLDDMTGNGTHWVAWYKNKNKKILFR